MFANNWFLGQMYISCKASTLNESEINESINLITVQYAEFGKGYICYKNDCGGRTELDRAGPKNIEKCDTFLT